MTRSALYDDGRIRCDGQALTIRRYYLWGAKRIRYTTIRGVQTLPLTGVNKVRRWRIWGTGDLIHWWNLDPGRPRALGDGAKLAGVWANVVGMVGCFDRLGEPFVRPVGDHTVIDVPMSFQAGDMVGRLAFDHAGQTAGLFIVRPEALG